MVLGRLLYGFIVLVVGGIVKGCFLGIDILVDVCYNGGIGGFLLLIIILRGGCFGE